MKYYDSNGNVRNWFILSLIGGVISSREEPVIIDEDDIVIPQMDDAKIVIDNETHQVVLMDRNNQIVKKVHLNESLINGVTALKTKFQDLEKTLPSADEIKNILSNERVGETINALNKNETPLTMEGQSTLKRIRSIFGL
jgi:hypothetical protein